MSNLSQVCLNSKSGKGLMFYVSDFEAVQSVTHYSFSEAKDFWIHIIGDADTLELSTARILEVWWTDLCNSQQYLYLLCNTNHIVIIWHPMLLLYLSMWPS